MEFCFESHQISAFLQDTKYMYSLFYVVVFLASASHKQPRFIILLIAASESQGAKSLFPPGSQTSQQLHTSVQSDTISFSEYDSTKLHTSFGTDAFNSFLLTDKDNICVKLPSSVGSSPVSLFIPNHRRAIFESLPRVEGMVPLNQFALSCTRSTFERLPSSLGIVPVKPIEFAVKFTRLVRNPNSVGMGPINPLSSISKCFNFTSQPISDGIVPII
mmetsp:Transcript_29310/g.44977  ORF Transcript_29310/g.44977 Transcript_29310/m.44977 type:complete len:217 (+) Transcript_29310:340-990(+)